MRVLALVTEAYGGRGGIAQYCRDVLGVLEASPEVERVLVLPRLISEPFEQPSPKINYQVQAATGKLRFLSQLLRAIFSRDHYDLILCGHVNLLPLAWLVRFLRGGELVLLVYGIDIWTRHSNILVRYLLPRVNKLVSISHVTLNRLQGWAAVARIPSYVLPNAINIAQYRPGPKDSTLIERYGLGGKKVMLTLGRLSSSERYKGVDEIMEALPELMRRLPDIAYLVVGDGDDRPRLQEKARRLSIEDRVIFAGYVSEEEKIKHYRLADAYVMPSSGEGFGFVFLEAMACGIPVVAGRADGGREALRDGMLGELVNPSDVEELIIAILRAISKPISVPEGLAYFAYPEFSWRCRKMVLGIMENEKAES